MTSREGGVTSREGADSSGAGEDAFLTVNVRRADDLAADGIFCSASVFMNLNFPILPKLPEGVSEEILSESFSSSIRGVTRGSVGFG